MTRTGRAQDRRLSALMNRQLIQVRKHRETSSSGDYLRTPVGQQNELLAYHDDVGVEGRTIGGSIASRRSNSITSEVCAS